MNVEFNRMKFNKVLSTSGTYLLLIVLSAWVALPFLWLIDSSFKPLDEIFSVTPKWIIPNFTLNNYISIITEEGFLYGLRNSIIIGFVTAFICVTIATSAGYSLARYRYPGRKTISGVLLASMMLPRVLLLLPMFLLWNKIGLYDTIPGLVLGFTALGLPYATLLLRSYFRGIPVELEEQAMIDGCTRLGAFWRITIPLSAPGLIAIMFTIFIQVWNDIIFTIFLSKSMQVQTVSVYLNRAFHTYRTVHNMGVVLAEGVVITIPLIILFIFLQTYLVKGLTAGAIKG